MTRIELHDTTVDVVVKMSDGNPGAMTAIAALLKESKEIDPQSAWGGLGPLLSLDTLGIYGTDIYILWNDKCGNDTRRFCVLLRADQFGMLPPHDIQNMAADQMRQVNLTGEEWAKIDAGVCEHLDEFMTAETWEERKKEEASAV